MFLTSIDRCRYLAAAVLAAALLSPACERSASDSDGGTDGDETSVVPGGRPVAPSASNAGIVSRYFEPVLDGTGESPEDLGERLAELPPARLWNLLNWLTSAEGEQGGRMGLAVVILGQLAEKDPVKAAHYLAGAGAPFGVEQSPASLMAFRRAMMQWSADDPSAACEMLKSFEKMPHLESALGDLATMHGERLQVSLAGAMPVHDLAALTKRWDDLELREAAGLLPRLLKRMPSQQRREDFKESTAAWLSEQWRREGPGAVFEWAVGMTDDALQEEILGHLEEPQE